MVTATFLTEDSYLGEITNPLTLNRYNYTLSNYLNYQDPSGHDAVGDAAKHIVSNTKTWVDNLKQTNNPNSNLNSNHDYGNSILAVKEITLYIANMIRNVQEMNNTIICEDTTWIPEVMQLDGTTVQEQNLKKWIDIINDNIDDLNISNSEKALLYWEQEKIDKVWEACQNYYKKTNVQVDPRLLLAIIAQEGTGSFNTSSTNLAADNENGINVSFDNDLALAVDLLGGKIIAYAYYQEDFSKAREQAYEQGLQGISDYDDILHYLNWETPRIYLLNPGIAPGVYASHNTWHRGVRSIYSELARDKVSADYTEYAISLGDDKFLELAEENGIEIPKFTFEAVQKGKTSTGSWNGDYVIIGSE